MAFSSVFSALNMAVLTVSDTRDEDSDISGKTLAALLQEAGHHLVAKQIVMDNIYAIRAVVSAWIADPALHVILVTGGTGLTFRDVTPEALRPLFDKEIPGFGEMFRHLSYASIGSSTVQSRALGGLANATLIFCMPGSTHACETAWRAVLKEQLDNRHEPCNFVTLLPRLRRPE